MSAKKQTIVPTKTLEGRDKKTGERITHVAGKAIDMPSAQASVLLNKGQAVEASETATAVPEPVTVPDPSVATVEQIVKVMGNVADGDFTADDRPTVEALEKLTGLEVSAKRRDAAWEIFVEAATEKS
tara:strand:+ start:24522 stop:24905 length:384 start_codon:yes stop_codon:yes gene_type:complete